MKASDNITRWIAIDYQASSLFHVIANDVMKETNAGRMTWTSLMNGSYLQAKCNLEGFNVRSVNWSDYMYVRIGLVANNENYCSTCDSAIGFGILFCRSKWKVVSSTCGNVYYWSNAYRYNIATWGYILVQ